MAVNEAGQLQFCGPGAKECEEFVAGVIKQAYEQGKPRDDAWIADFAATCLAENALRWWIELDEEVQGSWKLLRRALLSTYRPLFHGHSGEEAEQFVFSVRRRIRGAGKQKDNDWVIDFVSDCFVGDALRWHVSLDSSIREDWKLLEVAILAQYPRDGQSGPVLKMPVPPLAAAPPQNTKSRGRIRISKNNDTTLSYLSRNLYSDGRAKITSSAADVLEVEYNPSISSPQALLIPDGQIPNFDALGARWNSQDTTQTGSHAYICAVNTSNGDVSYTGVSSGPQMTSVWRISSKPSDATQLLAVTATNGAGDSLFSLAPTAVRFAFGSELALTAEISDL
ncbi:hypothetical protein M407DRAFT_20458 [Tulasnella calospora MUT 4182]|uniref:Retrotransposon gag domain-containing protein n=1 Tax=Tulasnella calospora MUT 4182 TaxID=1051891 RepID=A0A0C3QFX0_9AGAM|nr:hypothetical protein M407DRAFT_20458 [Tulasnella calospora MUT 4182]